MPTGTMMASETKEGTRPKAKRNETPEPQPQRKPVEPSEYSWDVIIIGAGPTGMATCIELQKAGFRALIIDKGCLVNSIYHYPRNMVFFTTPDLLEIGGIPFPTANQKPTRQEALEYYRKVAQVYDLPLRQYERVVTITGKDGEFKLTTVDRFDQAQEYDCKKLVIATGYYDLPNMLRIPGENLPKVNHYYTEPHPFYDRDVLVIGGKNSAAEAALDLYRHGARVTLVHRGPGIHDNVKYWVRPDIDNRIRNHEIEAYFNSSVLEIRPDSVVLDVHGHELDIKNDYVFALTGYHPDFDFLRAVGIELSSSHCRPLCDPETLESNVPGVYVAGVILAGSRTNEIFIENGRFHGHLIAAHLSLKMPTSRRRKRSPAPDAT